MVSLVQERLLLFHVLGSSSGMSANALRLNLLLLELNSSLLRSLFCCFAYSVSHHHLCGLFVAQLNERKNKSLPQFSVPECLAW